MGVLAGNVCHATLAAAADHVWSAMAPSLTPGSPVIVTIASYSGTAWNLKTYSDAVLISTVAAPTLDLTSCEPGDQVLDGIALGWLVVGVWVAAWAINVLRRALGWGY